MNMLNDSGKVLVWTCLFPSSRSCAQENDSSLEEFRKGGAKGSCFKQNGLWYHKWTPKP